MVSVQIFAIRAVPGQLDHTNWDYVQTSESVPKDLVHVTVLLVV